MSKQNGELPNGWAAIQLGDVIKVRNGYAFESKAFQKAGVPVVRQSNLAGDTVDLTGATYLPEEYLQEFARFQLTHGDILIGMSGSIGKLCIYDKPFPALQNQRTGKMEFLDDSPELRRFLWFYLQTVQQRLNERGKGIGVQNVSANDIESLPLEIAPLAEQRRIVAKLEALYERSRRAREALAEVEPLLEQFRQSMLAAAFRGDLTADWRAAHPDVEPASELLQRFRAERRHRWEQAELAKYETKVKKSPKNWQDKYAELEPVDASGLPELPQGWVWTTWESILSLDDGSFKRGPFGSALKKSIFVASGYKVYEQYCPINDDCSYVRYYITPEKYEELKAFAVKARDFLISCSGVTLGRITQVPDDFEEGIINQALLRVRINNEMVNDQFFLTLFRSPYFQKQIFDNATGSAIPNVKGVKDLKAIPVPVPPVAEQLEVLERLKERLDYTRGIEDGVKESNAAFDHLDQAVFAKAFRGALVPQDPKDEPASVLLERIRAQRAKQIEAAKLNKETSKTQRRNAMRKKSSEFSSQHQPLAEVLTTKGKPMSPEQLLTESGYDDDSIEDFYFALREEIAQGRIRENRSTESDVMLEAVKQ